MFAVLAQPSDELTHGYVEVAMQTHVCECVDNNSPQAGTWHTNCSKWDSGLKPQQFLVTSITWSFPVRPQQLLEMCQGCGTQILARRIKTFELC